MSTTNPPLIRAIGAIFALIAAAAMVLAFSLLFVGIMFGWLGVLAGFILFVCAAFNYVISKEVWTNDRGGRWLYSVAGISATLLVSVVVVFLARAP